MLSTNGASPSVHVKSRLGSLLQVSALPSPVMTGTRGFPYLSGHGSPPHTCSGPWGGEAQPTMLTICPWPSRQVAPDGSQPLNKTSFPHLTTLATTATGTLGPRLQDVGHIPHRPTVNL